jgi:hypothetical protein
LTLAWQDEHKGSVGNSGHACHIGRDTRHLSAKPRRPLLFSQLPRAFLRFAVSRFPDDSNQSIQRVNSLCGRHHQQRQRPCNRDENLGEWDRFSCWRGVLDNHLLARVPVAGSAARSWELSYFSRASRGRSSSGLACCVSIVPMLGGRQTTHRS